MPLKSRHLEKTVPQRAVFNYHWRHPKVKPVAKHANFPESIWEEVWVKPPGTCCTSKWGKERITEVQLQKDSMPKHFLEPRLIQGPSENDGDIEQQPYETQSQLVQRSERERCLSWMIREISEACLMEKTTYPIWQSEHAVWREKNMATLTSQFNVA